MRRDFLFCDQPAEEGKEMYVVTSKHKEVMAEDNERKWAEFSTCTHAHTHTRWIFISVVGVPVHEQDELPGVRL